jgi:hypothetical protein
MKLLFFTSFEFIDIIFFKGITFSKFFNVENFFRFFFPDFFKQFIRHSFAPSTLRNHFSDFTFFHFFSVEKDSPEKRKKSKWNSLRSDFEGGEIANPFITFQFTFFFLNFEKL